MFDEEIPIYRCESGKKYKKCCLDYRLTN
ncbi:MAG: hypothetical protein C4548_11455 [Desulfobacteraceae bacterium]|nr:MAG: hypothetical protein C4548_11455 [Desulfobacteraceae bacterium]